MSSSTSSRSQRTAHWMGRSGRTYTYGIFPLEAAFDALPGNYVFAREIEPGSFVPVRFGCADGLAGYPQFREELEQARRHGATHIHAHDAAANAEERHAEQMDLTLRWSPTVVTRRAPATAA